MAAKCALSIRVMSFYPPLPLPVSQAQPKHKGKISRVLAAKCALSIRVDALGETSTATIGLDARLKVEERLRQLEGKLPTDGEIFDNDFYVCIYIHKYVLFTYIHIYCGSSRGSCLLAERYLIYASLSHCVHMCGC